MSVGLIIHAIVLAIAFLSIAYLVFAAAQKAEGVLKPVGTILAAALAVIGALVLIGHLTAPMTGGRPFGIEMGPGAMSTQSTAAPSGTATVGDGAKPSGGEPSASGDQPSGGDAKP